jgi:hypothetical protein
MNPHQIYHYIKKELTLLASRCLTISHQVPEIGGSTKQFKSALKMYLQAHSFHFIDEYF